MMSHYRNGVERVNTDPGAEISQSVFIEQQLLARANELIGLSRSNDGGCEFRSAKYWFLWYASLADAKALEATYDLISQDGACFDLPIDCSAVFGRILIMAIATSDPAKAVEVFDTLIGLYATPSEADLVTQLIPKASD